jgi:hypothetical protein
MSHEAAHLRGRWLCAGIAIGLVVLLLILPLAGAAKGPASQATPRDLAPVIVLGSKVPLLQGAPTDELYVYAYRGSALQQVPFQVDQVTSGGKYTSAVGEPMGAADEIAFMASDLGAQAPVLMIQSSLPISATWYQIEVTDPLSPTVKGWAYVVRSGTLSKSYGAGYVSFDEGSSQIRSDQYALGFATTHPGFDYLALYGSGVDILDRTKIRLDTVLGTVTEEGLGSVPNGLLKNGPVRVIVRDGAIIGYPALIQVTLAYTLPVGVTTARASVDFSSAAVSSTFYNANTPAGVPIDGQPDAVAATPLSPWWQVTGATGTLLQAVDTSKVGGALTNYYRDNEALDPDDPGDNRSYGDTGLSAASPNPAIALVTLYAILPPESPNVGAAYMGYLAFPLQVLATAQNAQTHHVRLPMMLK